MEKVSKTLAGHLNVINELVERLDKNEGFVPLIEKDMLLAELRQMYDTVYRLETQSEMREELPTAIVNEQAPESVEEVVEPVVVSPIIEPETVETESHEEAPVVVDEAPVETREETPVEPVEEPVNESPVDIPAQTKDVVESLPEDVHAQDDEAEFLMADMDAEPVYAAETKEDVPTTPDEQQPTVEEVEGRQNDSLFEEEPQTIADKIGQMGGATIADKIAAGRTISDMLSEKVGSTENVERKVESVEQNANDNQPVVSAPVDEEEKKAEDTPQPSLFDFVKSSGDKPAGRTLADTLGESHNRPTVGILSALQSETATVGTNKVTDLRTVININDKFSFMNELFHNNMKGYNDFILKLNAINDREEALEYVESIASQYAWDSESMAVKTFYTVFDRKF